MTFEVVKVLNGHSGCQVELCRSGEKYFINKIAKDAGYSPRLMRQVEKQARLASLIPVPAVLEINSSDVPVSYKMEYIQGLDFPKLCLARPMSWINDFVFLIFQHFQSLRKSKLDITLSPLFYSKIKIIEDSIYRNPLCDAGRLTDIMSKLAGYDFSAVPATDSHGDMTMENIIFLADGTITFIDVLDGELETVWLDIAKLLYDLEIGWSLRTHLWREHHSSDERLLSMISRYLAEEIYLQSESAFPEIIPHLNALKAVQALRVLPYSKDTLTASRLTDYVTSLQIQN